MQVHALGAVAPHLPLAVKQFRANIIKMTCELSTAAAILFFVFSGMDEYSLIEATGVTPTFSQAEMRRYAYMCIGTTVLAISHVLFMMLVPESAWARVQLRAQDAVRSATRRLSSAPGNRKQKPPGAGRGNAVARGKLSQVVPCATVPQAEALVTLGDLSVGREAADVSCGGSQHWAAGNHVDVDKS